MTWETSELARYYEATHHNQRVHAAKFPMAFDVLTEIEACFALLGKNLVNPEVVLTGTFLLQSGNQFKAATGHAMAGALQPAFQDSRGCLEQAGHALLLKQKPELLEIFVSRHVDEKSMKAQKSAFHPTRVANAVGVVDQDLHKIYVDLYQLTIDFGGHPNPHGIFSGAKLSDDGLRTPTLCIEERPLLHTIKGVAQVGLTALHVLQHVFKPKFEILGVRQRLENLRRAQIAPDIGI